MRWFEERQELLAEGRRLPALPLITISDRNPPAFISEPRLKRLYSDNDDTLRDAGTIVIHIDTLLGCYSTITKKITIWRKGVEFVSRLISKDYQTVLTLVLVHELGHWFHHLAKTENDKKWRAETLNAATEEYHEAWAQWFAWIYANERDHEVLEAFKWLEKHQSDCYSSWRKAFGENCSRDHQKQVLRKLEGLRKCQEQLDLGQIRLVDLDEAVQKSFGSTIVGLER